MLQHSPSFERNHVLIGEVLEKILPTSGDVLEIGSGTGQHACYFAGRFPGLNWFPSDVAENLSAINQWVQRSALDNLQLAFMFDLHGNVRPQGHYSAIVCINVVHIVDWAGVKNLFAAVGEVLTPGGVFYVYGAYRYQDQPLEPSNQQFDQWLKNNNPGSGIRDFEKVNSLAANSGLRLIEDISMPSNNRSIWWRKQPA